jgi:hypothetical protein
MIRVDTPKLNTTIVGTVELYTNGLSCQIAIVKPTQRQSLHLFGELALLASMLAFSVPPSGQAIPDNGTFAGSGSINAPRQINPATGTTNPSARATQNLNPYLGSSPDGVTTKETLHISLEDAIARGLLYDLAFRRGIAAGINIMHINTELRVAWRRSLERKPGTRSKRNRALPDSAAGGRFCKGGHSFPSETVSWRNSQP